MRGLLPNSASTAHEGARLSVSAYIPVAPFSGRNLQIRRDVAVSSSAVSMFTQNVKQLSGQSAPLAARSPSKV
jgi:hypothetical protein